MAREKVVRRSMRSDEWLALRHAWLKRRLIAKSVEIEGWEVREGIQVADNTYEFYDEDYRPLKKGDMLFTPDGSAFFRVTARVPESMQNERVWFRIETAAELMIRINGKWAGGIDPNRNRMDVTDFIKDGELHFEIEGYNRSYPDDGRVTETKNLKGCRQVFNGASFVTLNEEVLGAIYDMDVLLDIINGDSFSEDYKAMVAEELVKACDLEDYEEMDDAVHNKQVQAMRDYIEEHIYGNKLYKGSGKAALVAHSHLDIAYYWRRMNTIHKNARTCLVQLRLMDRYPDFKYTHSQPYTYEQLEEFYPELFEEVKARVLEGRFEPVGAMYVEPDCNIPSCESLVRQCLYGQHYWREKFGKTIENCWVPDVFGNSWILPQILKKSGVKYFVSNKMSTWNDTNTFPHNSFIWKGIDGSKVYACVPPNHFVSWSDPNQTMDNWKAYQDKDKIEETIVMFGYGDGGSGVNEEMYEKMERFYKISEMPELRHITAGEYLSENFDGRDDLDVWDGELYLEMHRGTYTTKSDLKKNNRMLEVKMRNAEMLAVAAGDYDREKFQKLNKLLLVNQFHDILPGSHIPPAGRDALEDYGKLHKALDEIIAASLEKLTAPTSGSLLLVNTLPYERKGTEFVAFPGGSETRRGESGQWLSVDAPALSGVSVSLPEAKADNSWFTFEKGFLSTPLYTVSFDKDGSIKSLYDKELDREWVAENGRLNRLMIYKDTPGIYDAWDILPEFKARPVTYDVAEPLTLVASTPLMAEFKVVYKTNKSTWTQLIRFFKEDRKIEFEQQVDWHEKNKLAKAEFDTNVLTRVAKCDSSAGTILRDTHRNTSWQQARFEVCQHKFTDLSEPGGGIALINEGKYGISLEENQMGLSLLRATVRPDPESDEGFHNFCYTLLPHKGSMEEAGVIEASYAYNTPLLALKGRSAKEALAVVQTEDPNLFLQAVKKAETREDIVVRLTEVYGNRGSALISVPEGTKKAYVLNMLEDIESELPVENGKVKVAYHPNEILTLGFEK